MFNADPNLGQTFFPGEALESDDSQQYYLAPDWNNNERTATNFELIRQCLPQFE